MIAACIVYGILILLFLVMGVLFAKGKGQKLIAGYNTMSEREREKIDETKLLRIMRNGMFVFAGCEVLALIGTLTGVRPLIETGILLLIIAAVAWSYWRIQKRSGKRKRIREAGHGPASLFVPNWEKREYEKRPVPWRPVCIGPKGSAVCLYKSSFFPAASGGLVSPAREKPGKERGRGVPLHPRCGGR